MGPGSLVDVATDWCHEPVLKLDAGPLWGLVIVAASTLVHLLVLVALPGCPLR